MESSDGRWQTRFGRFVQRFGVERLCEELRQRGRRVTPAAVYAWVRGTHQPNARTAQQLVRLGEGEVGWNDIYEHVELVDRARGQQEEA